MDIKAYTSPKLEGDGTYTHLLYCPFTGLGLYHGFRGNRWLRNRIKIFKQFVIPSLEAQTCKDFILWISWRPEERNNPLVKELTEYLKPRLNAVHTFTGVCFYDDKYPPKEARTRLLMALHGALRDLVNITPTQWVLMTIQPSDDCYHKEAIKEIQSAFKRDDKLQAVGFKSGYLANYQTLEIAEWNPKTNPPFYTLKFPRPIFIDPTKHAEYTSLKHDVEGYPRGTPLPSHEWVKDCLTYGTFDVKGFLVGTHGENISTIWNHPYRGEILNKTILENFGISDTPLKLPFSIRRVLFSKLPHKVQRKLRYLAGEKKWIFRPIFAIIYNGLRS